MISDKDEADKEKNFRILSERTIRPHIIKFKLTLTFFSRTFFLEANGVMDTSKEGLAFALDKLVKSTKSSVVKETSLIKKGLIQESDRTVEPKKVKEMEDIVADNAPPPLQQNDRENKNQKQSEKETAQTAEQAQYIKTVESIGGKGQPNKRKKSETSKYAKAKVDKQTKTMKPPRKKKPEYIVEDVLGVAYFRGTENEVKTYKAPGLYFHCKWKDYPSEENTWEPIECIETHYHPFG